MFLNLCYLSAFEGTLNANELQCIMTVHKESRSFSKNYKSRVFITFYVKVFLGISLEVSGLDDGPSISFVRTGCEASL